MAETPVWLGLNYDFQLGRGVGGGWVGGWVVDGWFLLHNHATSWSNLQDCKISSAAEIPKLDRVWQYYKHDKEHK